MEDGFQGRAVLVFGASGALGSGVATAFAAAGATVTGADKVRPAAGPAPGTQPTVVPALPAPVTVR